MNDLIGQSFGRYHILERLGEGGMAIVFKAYDTRLETEVALKIIRTENLPPNTLQRALKRFEREAKALARLTHPNVVKVMDYGEHEDQPFLVMPYLPGGTLKQQMGQPRPWKDVVRLLLPIAEALDFAHSQNMVHRDVKPSNILLTQRGQPMLTDFGIAKILDLEETQDLTGTSAAVGTPEYMAPEQITAKSADHRADIYAFGIVLYEMITGRKPYTADTPMAVLIMHARDPLPSPRKIIPSLPEPVEKVLLKALAKKPEDRYQSMAELILAFEKLLAGNLKEAVPPVKKEPTIPKPVKPKAPPVDYGKKISDFVDKARPALKRAWPSIRMAGFAGLILIVLFGAGSWVVSLLNAPRPAGPTEAPVSVPLFTPDLPIVFSGELDGDMNVYRYDPDNSSLSQMQVGLGNNWEPTVSNLGNIYFTSDRDGGKAEIYRFVNGQAERVTDTPGAAQSWGPAISANNNLYFTSDQQDNKAEIYRLVNGKPERVTFTPGRYQSWSPVISGTGTVYYTTNRDDGEAEIYRLENGEPVRVTDTPKGFQSWGPVISATGTVYYTSNRDSGKAEIYRLENGVPVQVTQTQGGFQSWGPILGADGIIYYTSDKEDGKREVYKLVGGKSQRVTFTPGTAESLTDFLKGFEPDF